MTEILLAGESWSTTSMVVKGRDVAAATEYTEAADRLIQTLESVGASVTHQPADVALREFPRSTEALDEYDLVLLSDIGAQSLLLTPQVAAGETDVNRCRLLSEWVADGGALGMLGGYTSFAGEHGAAGYARTELANVLPVEIAHHDDRVETPEGATPINDGFETLPEEWPHVLGYNALSADPDADVLATVRDDPLVVVGDHGEGRTLAYATDCAPHWAPEAFLEWEHLPELWDALLDRLV
ncbi:glutamine amidotransferase [Salinarchaeum laminariae]|uniref:glutamine amidotransferase n=1 Tax=Salinarchaeum laminariae TaxID=869888 RepID=UPI0020C01A7E|nr:glutamine amidotransferase [Salinarchaeum laminariae]